MGGVLLLLQLLLLLLRANETDILHLIFRFVEMENFWNVLRDQPYQYSHLTTYFNCIF